MSLLSSYFVSDRALSRTQPRGPVPATGWLVRHTLQVAWPAMVEQFLVSLVSLVDTMMVGVLGAYAISAIGLCGQPKFITLVPFFSLNVGLSAVISRRKGEGDRAGANRAMLFGLKLAVFLGLVLGLLGVRFSRQILLFAGAAPDTIDAAQSYFDIIVGGMVFNVLSLVINAAQRGVGNTRIAMRTNLTSNLVNLVLNYCLIGGHLGFPALGVKGDAIATVSGTVVACAMSFASILKPDRYLFLGYGSRESRRVDKKTTSALWRVSSASLVEQLFLRIGFMTYAILMARLGTIAFAAHQIGMNILSLSFAVGNGISIAVVALVGQSLGEGRPDMARLYGHLCQKLGLLFSVTMALVYTIFGKAIYAAFSSDSRILGYGERIMALLSLIVVLQVSQVIFSGCLRGSGDTRSVAMVALVSVAFIRPFCGWLFTYPLALGLMGGWMGLLLDQFMRFLLTFFRFRGGKWLTIKL
ncbi:MAG: MATE family efflux transporter [Sphaerochaetaceae bacterium]|nr:MATE family efflux transporter [Spirochaetaceae bacterium]MDY6343828.1 MATE family efflux transporter [Sphaerochaetaceae bacterium]